jgi:hypothetical protein
MIEGSGAGYVLVLGPKTSHGSGSTILIRRVLGETVSGSRHQRLQECVEARPPEHLGGQRDRGRARTQGLHPGGQGHLRTGRYIYKYPYSIFAVQKTGEHKVL